MSVSSMGIAPGPAANRRLVSRRALLPPTVAADFAFQGGVLLRDLSETGLGGQAMVAPAVGSTSECTFELPDSGPVQAFGTVTWSDRSGRFGLHFDKIQDADRGRLTEWLAALPQYPVAPPPAAAPSTPVARDIDDLSVIRQQLQSGRLSADSAMQVLADSLRAITGATGVAVAIEAEDGIVCRAASGTAPEIGAHVDPQSGLTGECVRTGDVVRCADTESDPRVDRVLCRKLEMRSIVVVPVLRKDRVVGVVEGFSSTPHAFQNNAVRLLQKAAHVVSTVAWPGETATVAPPKQSAPAAPPARIAPSAQSAPPRKGPATAVVSAPPVPQPLPASAEPTNDTVVLQPATIFEQKLAAQQPAVEPKPAEQKDAAPASPTRAEAAPAAAKPAQLEQKTASEHNTAALPTPVPAEAAPGVLVVQPPPSLESKPAAKPKTQTPVTPPRVAASSPTAQADALLAELRARTVAEMAATQTAADRKSHARKTRESDVSAETMAVGAADFKFLQTQETRAFPWRLAILIALAIVIAVIAWQVWPKSAAPAQAAPAASAAAAPAAAAPAPNPSTTAVHAPGVRAEAPRRPAANPRSNDREPDTAAPLAIRESAPSPAASADAPPPVLPASAERGNPVSSLLARTVAAPVLAPELPRSTGVTGGRLKTRINPTYPPAARALSISGPVVLNATVDTSGKVIRVKTVSGNPVLASAAENAVRRWVYEPFRLNGKAIQGNTTITINFSAP